MAQDTSREERALDALVSAIVEHRKRKVEGPRSFKIVRLDDLAAMPLLSRREEELGDLLDDPVDAALRIALTRIGEHLFRILGSTRAMAEVARRATDRASTRSGYRSSVIDHAWNDIGSDTDRWCS